MVYRGENKMNEFEKFISVIITRVFWTAAFLISAILAVIRPSLGLQFINGLVMEQIKQVQQEKNDV
jgi:hypothetical protein